MMAEPGKTKQIPIPLNGRWRPEINPGSKVDPGDFRLLTNMRYGDYSPQSIFGMDGVNVAIEEPGTHMYHYLYIGHNSGVVTKLDLNDFTTEVTVNPNATSKRVGGIDLVLRRAIYCNFGNTTVTFIDIDSMTTVGTYTTSSAEGTNGQMIVDQTNGDVYIGELTNTESQNYSILKIDIASMTLTSSLLYTNEIDGYYPTPTGNGAMAIIGDTLFFNAKRGAGYNNVGKITISTFTKNGVVNSSAGFTYVSGEFPSHNLVDGSSNIYWVAQKAAVSQYGLLKYNSSGTYQGVVDTNSGETLPDSGGCIDTNKTFIYVAGGRIATTPSEVVQFTLSTFTRNASVSLPDGNYNAYGIIYDQLRDYIYVSVATGSTSVDGIYRLTSSPFAVVDKKITTNASPYALDID